MKESWSFSNFLTFFCINNFSLFASFSSSSFAVCSHPVVTSKCCLGLLEGKGGAASFVSVAWLPKLFLLWLGWHRFQDSLPLEGKTFIAHNCLSKGGVGTKVFYVLFWRASSWAFRLLLNLWSFLDLFGLVSLWPCIFWICYLLKRVDE